MNFDYRTLMRFLACLFTRRLWIYLLIALHWPLDSPAQYVRRENFANEHQRRARYELDDWVSYTTTRSFSSMAVSTDYIFIATRDGGILRYQIYQDYWDYPYTTSSGLPDNRIEDIVYDPRSAFLWVKTPRDVAYFDPAAREWVRESENPGWIYQFPDSVPPVNPNVPFKEKFFGRNALFQLPTYFANGMYNIQNDWLLMDSYFQEFPFIGYLVDRYDRIWFLIEGFGIGRGETYTQRADFFGVGLPDIFPRALAYQGDDLWFGGLANDRGGRPGIARWPYERPEWDYFQARRIPHLPNDNVAAIQVDGDSVWFGTDYGVSLFNAGKNTWRNIDETRGLVYNQVRDLAIMGDHLYAATEVGIGRINRFTGLAEKIKDARLINLPTYRLAAQGDTVWAATFRGIFRFTGARQEWEFVPSRAAIQDLEVTAVSVFGHEAWFASRGGIMGLNLQTDTWESFPQVALEIAGPYEDILATKEAVWAATPEGLLKYDRERGYWKLFTTRDGLLDDHCRRLLLDGDYLWIVTDGGVTQFRWNSPYRID